MASESSLLLIQMKSKSENMPQKHRELGHVKLNLNRSSASVRARPAWAKVAYVAICAC